MTDNERLGLAGLLGFLRRVVDGRQRHENYVIAPQVAEALRDIVGDDAEAVSPEFAQALRNALGGDQQGAAPTKRGDDS